MAIGPDGYPDLATLLAASDLTELTSLDPDVQAGLRASAIGAVEGFCVQSFAEDGTVADPVERVLDGPGAKKLWLPKRLAELVSLKVDGASIDETDVAIGSAGPIPEGANDHLYLDTSAFAATWLTRALRPDEPPLFAAGVMNVRVSGIWGWKAAEFPVAIEQALRIDMEDQAAAAAHGLGSSIRALRALGAREASQGPLSVTAMRQHPVLSDRALELAEPYVFGAHGAVV